MSSDGLTRKPADDAGTRRIRVLYVGGVGRSGSTLFDRMLGQLPGHVSVGELAVHVWERCLGRDWPCGCGQPFSQCEFWTEVGKRAYGGWDTIDLDEMIKLKRSVDKTKYIPFIVAAPLLPSFRRRLERYRQVLAELFAAIQEVTGAHVIVDSSKDASTLYVLRGVPNLDVRVAHMVRDPRGVAYSWSKSKKWRLPNATGQGAYMPTWSARTAGRRWVTVNSLVAALGARVPMVRVRYEDMIRDPRRELTKVAGLWDEKLPAHALDFLAGDAAELAATHTAAGNPNRFSSGPVVLKPDEQWREALPAGPRRTVEAITLPLRVRYGYAGAGERRAASQS